MKYINRNLRPISESEWKMLYRDPEYATLKAVELPGGCLVEASWVGIVPECEERNPLPFLVQVLVRDSIGKSARPHTWHATEAEALREADRVIREMRKELKA